MNPKQTKIPARQTFSWVLVSELEMAPTSWGRPLRTGDVRAIAAGFDPDLIGAMSVWHRPDLPPGRGRYVICDGQHRCAALRLMGYDDQKAPCLLYTDLTMETAAELSLGLQERRNLHALDKHRAALAAHDRRAVDIDKVLTYSHLQFAYTTNSTDRGRLSAVAAVYLVWDRMGGTGLERVLDVCSLAWGCTSQGFASVVLRLVMTVMAAHDGQVDDQRLAETMATRSPAQWVSKDIVPRRSLASIAQDVITEYNKKARGTKRLSELTPSEYQAAAKRQPRPTVRGPVEAPKTTVNATSMRIRVRREGKEEP
jgi:hypothetical protein